MSAAAYSLASQKVAFRTNGVVARRLTTACSRGPSQSSNLHAQICRLSGARLMRNVRRHREVDL